MDLLRGTIVIVLGVALTVSTVAGGYGRPADQQYPWNTYTTTRRPAVMSNNDNQIASSSTTLTSELPEATPLPPMNSKNDFIVIFNPETNEQYLMPRGIWERFFVRKSSSKSSESAKISKRSVRKTENDMDTAASNVAGYYTESSNENIDNFNYGSSYQGSAQRGISPYFHSRTDGVDLFPGIFQNYNPQRAIYSYSAIGLCSYGQCNYRTGNNYYKVVSDNIYKDNQRNYFPPSTIKPRTPKITSTWIPIIYRTSTAGRVEEPITTPVDDGSVETKVISENFEHSNELVTKKTTTLPVSSTSPLPSSSSTTVKEILSDGSTDESMTTDSTATTESPISEDDYEEAKL